MSCVVWIQAWKHHFHMEENQKIYCTLFSAIRLRHVGLHTGGTGWKIESPSSFSTRKTLKNVLWISILSLPTKLREQSGITLANRSGVTSSQGQMREKLFLFLARKGVQPSRSRLRTWDTFPLISTVWKHRYTNADCKSDTFVLTSRAAGTERVGMSSTRLSAASALDSVI